MRQSKPGCRADRDEIRRSMLQLGMSVDEIAVELRARYGFGIRAAYRYACGLTQDGAAASYNRTTNDARAAVTGGRICEWEQWPTAGKQPTAYTLVVLAESYGTTPMRLLTAEEFGLLADRDQKLLRSRVRPDPDNPQTGDTSTGAHAGSNLNAGRDRPPTRTPPGAVADQAHVSVRIEAQRALDFLAWAESTNVGQATVANLQQELAQIAHDYVHAPLPPLFNRLVVVRDRIGGLLRKGRQPVALTRELLLLAGTAHVLLAHASQNLGDEFAAASHARTAWTCADQAEHNGLRAWVRGTEALIAEWSGRPQEAILRCQQGAAHASTTTARVRLAAIEARCQARVGHGRPARAALECAAEARTSTFESDGLDQFGGLLAFPEAKQHYYAGSTLVMLGDAVAAEIESARAIAMYESGPQQERSYGDEAIARIDLAIARLRAEDIDGVSLAIRPVLDLPEAQRIVQVNDSMRRLASQLSCPRVRSSAESRDIREAIDEFRAAPGMKRLRTAQ